MKMAFDSKAISMAENTTSHRNDPVEIQGLLGSDIQMQLDECIRLPSPKEEVQRAMELSLRWAERSREQFEAMGGAAKGAGALRYRSGRRPTGPAGQVSGTAL